VTAAPPAGRSRAVVLWAALAAGQVVFAAVFFAFAARVRVAPAPPAVGAMVGALAALAAALSFVAPRRIRTGAGPEATAFVRALVGGAIAEAGTMMALAGWFVSRGPALLAVAAAAFGAFLLHFPTAARYAGSAR
jgi:hypothetical protein